MEVSHFKSNCRHHPSFPVMTLPLPVCSEIIDFLQLNVVPLLKDKLRKKNDACSLPPCNQNYLLSDIFCSEDEDGFVEVDNS